MSELTTAARPYAKAVFELARDDKSLDTWSERLRYLAAILSDVTFKRHLDTPGLTHQKRADMVTQVAADYLDELGINFVKLMAKNRRLNLLNDVSSMFEQYRAKSEGLVEASVISATELSEQQSNNIAESMSKRLQRDVIVSVKIDPSLISGAIIRAGDLVIDGSLTGKLKNLRQQLAD